MRYKLKTRWAHQVTERNVWKEYPRPELVRDSYVNLNGRWNCRISTDERYPRTYQDEILVPFSPEAPLSGIMRQLKPFEILWYHRMLPEEVKIQKGKRWILHFGAVDQYVKVYINGDLIKEHMGGYLPFSIDVTKWLREIDNEVVVMVRDLSDTSWHSRGKQKLMAGGMFYTAQSGIWQTVWMEQVPENYIRYIRVTPDLDRRRIKVRVASKNSEKIVVNITGFRTQSHSVEGASNQSFYIPIKDVYPWSPEDPYLYNMEVIMGEDVVKSYFALRKIEVRRDYQRIPRIFLNNQPYFQKGILDQGYWPEGLYTPPCDEAMIFDIQKMKDLGFNMIRKHIKIEPSRWYYHCDRLGMLVWQDMVNGGRSYHHWFVTYGATAMMQLGLTIRDGRNYFLGRTDKESRKEFVREMKGTIAHLNCHPSIVTWVIFNEGWGQFSARQMTYFARRCDGTRLIDAASGWFDQNCGDIRSIHEYFFPLRLKPDYRAAVLTEYGGYSFRIPDHSTYQEIYGYRVFNSKESISKAYRKLIKTLILPNISKGLCGTIYTQLSDIEEEVNGIYSYDREVLKLDEKVMRKSARDCREKHREAVGECEYG